MTVWLAAASAFLLVDLFLVLFVFRRTIKKLRRELDEAKLYEVHLGATDQLIEFRLRQLSAQIEELERARDESAAGTERARDESAADPERSPRRRRLGRLG